MKSLHRKRRDVSDVRGKSSIAFSRMFLVVAALLLFSCWQIFSSGKVILQHTSSWLNSNNEKGVVVASASEHDYDEACSTDLVLRLNAQNMEVNDKETQTKTHAFNPLKDIVLHQNQQGPAEAPDDPTFPHSSNSSSRSKIMYSSFHCVQTKPNANAYPDWVRRTCHYENLYYDVDKQEFQFFASPAESAVYGHNATALTEDLTTANGMLPFEFELTNPSWVVKELIQNQRNWKFAPTVYLPDADADTVKERHTTQNTKPLLTTIVEPAETVFILYQNSWVMNVGHILFDDNLIQFLMMEKFHLSDIDGHESPSKLQRKYQHIPFSLGWYRCTQGRNHIPACLKFLKRVAPKAMGIQVDSDIFRLGTAFAGEYRPSILTTSADGGTTTTDQPHAPLIVRLPRTLSGSASHSYLVCQAECVAHLTSLMYRYRKWMFQNMFGFQEGSRLHEACRPGSSADDGQILVYLPIGNTHRKGVDYRDLDDVVATLKEKYGDSRVLAIDMSTIPFEAQVVMTAKAKVLITNHGGGSSTCLFLQKGATSITIYTNHNGQVTRRDSTLYDAIAYFRTDWLPVSADIPKIIEHVELALSR